MVMGIKALSLELLLCCKVPGPDASVDRGLCNDSNNLRKADEGLWLLLEWSGLVVRVQ